MAAAALGSAAILYRTGSVAKAAQSLDKGYRFLKKASTTAGKALGGHYLTLEDFKYAAAKMKKDWRTISSEQLDKPIRLRADNPNTMFALAHGLANAKNSASHIGGKLYRQNHLIAPAKDDFSRNYSNGDINRNRNFMEFINRIAQNVHDDKAVFTEMKRHKFSDADQTIAGDIITTMRGRDTDDARKSFVDSVRQVADKTYEKLHDIEFLEKHYGKKSAMNKLLDGITGERSASIGDLLAQRQRIKKSSFSTRNNKGAIEQNDTLDILDELHQHYKKQGASFEKRFLELRPDAAALRKTAKGEVYSFNSPSEMLQDALNLGSLTLPGKLLKLRVFEQASKAPVVDFIGNATKDPSLAAIVNPTHSNGYKNKAVEGNYVRILDTIYSADGGELNEVATNIKAISSRFGWAQRMQHQLAGDTAYQESSNALFRWLDIGQDRVNYSGSLTGNFFSRFRKFSDKNWRQNVFDRFLSPDKEESDALHTAMAQNDVGYGIDYLDNAKRVQKFLRENTYSIEDDVTVQLKKKTTGMAKELFTQLSAGDNDSLLESLLSKDVSSFRNKDLTYLLNKYIHDPVKARNTLYLRTDRTRLSTSGGSLFDPFDPTYNNESADFWETLKTETGKEAFLQHASSNPGGRSSVLELIDSVVAPRREIAETKRLAHLAMFQEKTNINDLSQPQGDAEMWQKIKDVESVMNDSIDSVDQDFRKEFKHMMNENISITESRDIREGVVKPEHYNNFVHIRKAVDPFDVIKSINESIKTGSTAPLKDTGSLFFKQFNAGRKDMENVTMATYAPYFMLSRLSDDLNMIGLGFSRDSMGSFGQLATSIFTKRILPIGIGATYAEWMDDTSQEVTGTSISGAAANGFGNVDLASRKALDSFGITPWLKELKSVNPIMQYWGGHEDFQNYNERKKYYESGYDPVRRGAWWTFGGVQEARGNEIEYWAPSYARRINSDYKDKSLYDGYFDKWSHSLLPTPSNPLSPLMAVLDPYWLEEKHADDRPYPISGTMFAEGTPWGAVLNPTVGALIKPQKELHEYRMRNGVDIKSALHALNENIKQQARDLGSQNLIALNGNNATPVRFTAYDAPTEDTKAMSVQYNTKAGGFTESSSSYGVYNGQQTASLSDGFNKFKTSSSAAEALLADDNLSIGSAIKNSVSSDEPYHSSGEIIQNSKGELGTYSGTVNHAKTSKELKEETDLSLSDSLKLDAMINGDDGTKMVIADLINRFNPKNLLRAQNEATKNKAIDSSSFDDSEGIITPEKLAQFKPSQGMALLDDADTISELINAGKGSDFVRDAATSTRLITGIYGYMGSQAAGFGVYRDKRIATSANMTSISRSFWDSGVGGAGGDIADIFRRFIPDFKRGNMLNPLMNEMPDWMPDRFRYGDPFAAIKEGEMRMPGKGWESLNELHPDQYGRYGAFDRFKILADIAPFSPEYKMWREIAKKTVTDPGLKEEMADIRSRVSQQGKQHDFFNYNVVGKSLDYENVEVSEVLGYGKFRSGSTIYKMAGARVLSNENQSMTDMLGKYLHQGMTVTVAKDSNDAYQTNNDADKSTNVAVYIDGENLAEQMISQGDAARKKGDTSTPAVLGRLSSFQKLIGYGSELVAHADLPWLSDQWLRVRTPLESYQAEQVYGTPYQSWEHPIDTFLEPAMERAMHQSSIIKNIIKFGFHELEEANTVGKTAKHAAMAAHVFSDRGAFIGAAVSNLVMPGASKPSRIAMSIGSNIATIGHFITGGNSMIDEVASGASIGLSTAKFFGKNRAVGAAAGAVIGVAYRMLRGNSHDWIPERAQKRWEMQDYFDRLTYLKYMGLYKEAARRAKDEEGVDIDDLSERREDINSKVQQTLKRLERIKDALRSSQNHTASDEKKQLSKMLNNKINELDKDTTIIEGGKWTHSALIYKQAAESTMYGIGSNSSWAQIITALPKGDKEYFMEFVKERNPDKRQEILNFASPFLKKALSLAWGTAAPKSESNKDFFKKHALPTAEWAGWKPDVDLKDVEVKTIENEGMNLSDFGYYESQLRNPSVTNAPTINTSGASKKASMASDLKKILQGKGLKNVDVNVATSTDVDSHKIISDISIYTGSERLQRMVQDSMQQQT